MWKKPVGLCTEEADLEAFRQYTAPSFVFEIMGAQPAAGERRGVDAMKRHFTAFKDNFTAEFQVTATEIYLDAKKRTAAVRLHSHPLIDKGGGECLQRCEWFVYFDDNDKITRITQYDDGLGGSVGGVQSRQASIL
jgi:ketosteroid isomerase-like protein